MLAIHPYTLKTNHTTASFYEFDVSPGRQVRVKWDARDKYWITNGLLDFAGMFVTLEELVSAR
jgi:hypothetical protein